jgi:hypothetical protein
LKEIKFSNGNITIVDDEDYEKFSSYKYYENDKGYAQRSYGPRSAKKHALLHREIMNAPKGLFVDHINHNKLDNRKSNLRLVTNQQNRFNSNKMKIAKTSKYKGVCLIKKANLWKALIRFNGKDKIIGRFESEETAAVAYNIYAKKYFGEYALLNDVPFEPDWESKKIGNRVRGTGTSKFIGVSYRQKYDDWICNISVNGKSKYLGSFKNEIEAAKAFNEAALKHRGPNAKINKID